MNDRKKRTGLLLGSVMCLGLAGCALMFGAQSRPPLW